MDKIDFKKTDRTFCTGKTDRWELVDVPEWQFLSAEGQGDPQCSPGYTAAVSALYSLSYGLKFRSKSVQDRDCVVGPLEGLWWADDMQVYRAGDRAAWKWRMMIRQPDWITDADLEAVRATVLGKIKGAEAEASKGAIKAVALNAYEEGTFAAAALFRPLCRRGAAADRSARPVHARTWLSACRAAPRDLSQRSAKGGAGKDQDAVASACAPAGGRAGDVDGASGGCPAAACRNIRPLASVPRRVATSSSIAAHCWPCRFRQRCR